MSHQEYPDPIIGWRPPTDKQVRRNYYAVHWIEMYTPYALCVVGVFLSLAYGVNVVAIVIFGLGIGCLAASWLSVRRIVKANRQAHLAYEQKIREQTALAQQAVYDNVTINYNLLASEVELTYGRSWLPEMLNRTAMFSVTRVLWSEGPDIQVSFPHAFYNERGHLYQGEWVSLKSPVNEWGFESYSSLYAVETIERLSQTGE